MEDSEYDNIARLEDTHWWYRGMAAISETLLKSSSPSAGLKILDAGCGTGGMLRRLARWGRGTGLDFSPRALAHAQRTTPHDLCRATITQLPFTNQAFDLITSFDVLYHRAVADDQTALNEFYRVLKPRGRALLRVPAFESLRGAHDLTVHTRQRYTAADLRVKLARAGFRVRRLTYANFFLAIPIYFIRQLQRSQSKKESSDVELPALLINTVLELLLRSEALLMRFIDLPFGVSLFAIAYKD